MLKSMAPKRPTKDERERLVLLGLVDLYLKTGRPIGSTTLQENGFQSLSSATIRNYFAKLEEAGFLKQQHSSGGRIPTEEAYRLYIDTHLNSSQIGEKQEESLKEKLSKSTREVTTYLQKAAESISEMTSCAVFLSSPRFDQDFVLDVKLVPIDTNRCLCILITDFGMVHTETLFVEKGLEKANLEKITEYLQWRITGLEKPKLNSEEEKLASRFYKEIMLRHIVSYSNFTTEDIYKTGFSKLLSYPDFNNAASLANGLSLFENENDLRLLIKKASENHELSVFLGSDLDDLSTNLSGCSVIQIPYYIHQTFAGVIAVFGPNRLPYCQLFGKLKSAAEAISETLTNSLYKYKITFRSPESSHIKLESKKPSFVEQAKGLLIDKKEEE